MSKLLIKTVTGFNVFYQESMQFVNDLDKIACFLLSNLKITKC